MHSHMAVLFNHKKHVYIHICIKLLLINFTIDNILHLDMKLITCTHVFNRTLVVSL